MIIRELKRYIFSPLFIAVVVAALGIMVYPIRDSFRFIFVIPQSYLYYIKTVHSFGTFDLFAPAIAAIPCGAAFYNDFKTGYCKFIFTRTGRMKYLISKTITCAITGGLAVFVPNLLLDVFLWIFAKPHSIGMPSFFNLSIFSNIEFVEDGIIVMITLLAISFIFGASWALVGLAFSTFILNRFAACVAPFMLYFSVSLILGQTEETLRFSPLNMLFPNYNGIPSIGFCFVYQLILMIIAALLFAIRANWRIKNDL